MNLDVLRSFFAVVEHGSLNKAAAQLHVSQSTLTRQMHTLEQEIGGRLLERSATGVALTGAGHLLLDGTRPLVAALDRVLDDTRKLARGQSSRLRIGYLMSAAAEYLNPALVAVRRVLPKLRIELVDLSTGEQIEALRKGEIDVALLGTGSEGVAREFFVRRIATLPVRVALPDSHRLAPQPVIRLYDLRNDDFIGANERDIPGHNRWITQLCRPARFRPRFVVEAQSLSHALASIVSEGAVLLLPEYATKIAAPGVVYRPLRDTSATCDLSVAWQRGKISAPVQALIAALQTKPALPAP